MPYHAYFAAGLYLSCVPSWKGGPSASSTRCFVGPGPQRADAWEAGVGPRAELCRDIGWHSMDVLARKEEVDQELEPEQVVVESDPSGRWSRVCMLVSCLNLEICL